MENTQSPKGVFIFYLFVGQYPIHKVHEYIKKYREDINADGFMDRMKEHGFEFLFVPDRERSRFKFLKL